MQPVNRTVPDDGYVLCYDCGGAGMCMLCEGDGRVDQFGVVERAPSQTAPLGVGALQHVTEQRDGPRALALMNDLLAQQKTVALAETMAMTLAELGRFDEAVSWQQAAIASAKQSGNSPSARAMAENLKLYESHKPCRIPWAADDPVFYPRPGK